MYGTRPSVCLAVCLVAVMALFDARAVSAQSTALGNGMNELIEMYETANPKLLDALKQHVAVDDEVLVTIRLLPGYAVRSTVWEPGIKSIRAVQRPTVFSGTVQSQALAFEKVDLVLARGIDGRGVGVGALSDSFDKCATCRTHAADDIASGDLPLDGVTVRPVPTGPTRRSSPRTSTATAGRTSSARAPRRPTLPPSRRWCCRNRAVR